MREPRDMELPVTQGLEARADRPCCSKDRLIARSCKDLLDHLSPRPILLRDLSVRLLAGVLTQADLFLGHDSGVTHLAALLGVPTVALFGPTDPARWAPQGDWR